MGSPGAPGTGLASDQSPIPSSSTLGSRGLNESPSSAHRRGRVYFLLCKPEGTRGRIKIGWTDAPKARQLAIERQCPYPVTMLATIPGSRQDERAIHTKLASGRCFGEWFQASDELLDFIEAAASSGASPLAPLPGKTTQYSTGVEMRRELARMVRACVEPCPAGEKQIDQQKRAAKLLGVTFGQAWRMWCGRGSPSLYLHVKRRFEQLGSAR